MRRLFLVMCSALFALPLIVANAALPENASVLKGTAYIRAHQTADGGLADSPGQNMDAIFALRAAGYDPAKETVGGKGPAEYLKANAAAVSGAAAAGKAALGAKAAGLDPKSVNGVDLIARINAAYDSAKGTYAGDDFSQSIAMLGLICTGNSVPAAAATALKSTQVATDGGWGFGGTSDPDTTAIVVQALLAAGVPRTDVSITKALAYFKAGQGTDGGFGYDTSESNASSTAFVVQALIALGENPEGADYTKSGVTPVGYLLGQQNDDGSFKGFDPAFSTNQVVPALAGRTFCNAPDTAITRTRPVVTPTATPTAPAPTATTTAAPTTPAAAPKPPSTGNSRPDDGSASLELELAAVVLMIAGTAAVFALRRRNSR
ncbi:MAG: prenyltransferase/squalene oxidase repeat-containing protein [bacterium]